MLIWRWKVDHWGSGYSQQETIHHDFLNSISHASSRHKQGTIPQASFRWIRDKISTKNAKIQPETLNMPRYLSDRYRTLYSLKEKRKRTPMCLILNALMPVDRSSRHVDRHTTVDVSKEFGSDSWLPDSSKPPKSTWGQYWPKLTLVYRATISLKSHRTSSFSYRLSLIPDRAPISSDMNPNAHLQGQTPITLNILIVGGGIGGLAAAFCLGRSGHRITVIEQQGLLDDTGAGIQLAPSKLLICYRTDGALIYSWYNVDASRLLIRWGLQASLDKLGVRPVSSSLNRCEYHVTLQ